MAQTNQGGSDSAMPRVEDYKGDSRYRSNVAGTDSWNGIIYAQSVDAGVDPVFVKAVMAKESGGKQDAKNGNTNTTTDYGLMQVNSAWGDRFDYNRMMTDPNYAVASGIEVIKIKMKDGDINAIIK